MTTNGVPFYRLADQLAQAGLTGVNISLDTFDPDRFQAITGVDALPFVLQAIDSAKILWPGHVALNMVVLPGNIHEIPEFVRFAANNNVLVRFCELTPHGPYMQHNLDFFRQNHVPKDQILTALSALGTHRISFINHSLKTLLFFQKSILHFRK
jgi:cyclic pyranopterin phosphate synthase